MPPSAIVIASPLIPLAESDARNAIVSAISRGSTGRCAGIGGHSLVPGLLEADALARRGLADEIVRHLGLRPAGQHRVARDAVSADVLGDRAHQSEQAVPGGAVGRHGGDAVLTRARAHDHDPAEAALDHVAAWRGA